MEEDFSCKVPFSALCDLFERIFLSGKANQKKKLLQTFFGHYKSHQFHPLLRLLLPQLDKERQTYGMKETTLGKYYVDLLNISPDSEDGRRLLHWKRPTKQGEMEAGDFGNAVYLSLEKRCQAKGLLSLFHVNKCLDKLNTCPNRNDKLTVLKWMLRKTTATEQKWFVRIIVKELKIGVSEKTILNTFHPDALDLFQATSSLVKVANELTDPSIRIQSAQGSISLFNPVKPQLAARKNPEEVIEFMKGSPFVIETKFDGERIQIHKQGDTIRLYSRNSNEVTSIYGRKIIPNIKKHVKVSKCILDGELLVWDNITQKFEDFGKLKTFANFERSSGTQDREDTGDIGSNLGKQLCYIVFDILLVNDKVVTDLTLQQRMLLVKRCVEPMDKVVEIVEQQSATTNQEIITALDAAIMNREEGIMVKNLNSTYIPGERKEKWIKLKPEYIDGLVTDMDLLIIGGYYGSGIGRRGGTISHFLLGVAAPITAAKVMEGDQEEQNPTKFLSFCKVGSGYTDNELNILQKMLQKHWRVFNASSPPDCIELVPPCKEKPDVWIDPKKSRILQVKAAQIVPSEKFMTKFTLRFPRVQKLRLDKNWYDAMNWEELQQIIKNGRTSKRMSEIDTEQPAPKKRKLAKPRRSLTVLPQFQQADTKDLSVIDKLFQGQEICILTGDNTTSKSNLERLVFQHGAKCVQYPTDTTHIIVAEKKTLRVSNLIKTSRFDVVRPSWIVGSIESNYLLALEPRFMLFSTERTKRKFLENIDKYGDHYSREVTPDSLKQTLRQIKQVPQLSLSALEQFEMKIFQETPWWAIFRNYTFYLDKYSIVGDKKSALEYSYLDFVESMARFYGAEVTHRWTRNITHIIMDPKDTSRLSTFQEHNSNNNAMTFHIVSYNWLIDSIEQHEDLDEQEYSNI